LQQKEWQWRYLAADGRSSWWCEVFATARADERAGVLLAKLPYGMFHQPFHSPSQGRKISGDDQDFFADHWALSGY
jgi:hypothetical protein